MGLNLNPKALGRWLCRSFVGLIKLGLQLGLIGLVVVSALGYVVWTWPWELLSHFRVQYWGLAALAVLLLSSQILFNPRACLARRWLWVAWLAVGINTADLLPWYLPSGRGVASQAVQVSAVHRSAGAAQRSLRLLSANVHTQNREFGATVEAVRSQDPDIAIFIEITAEWVDYLEQALAGHLPYFTTNGAEILLMSRFPLTAEAALDQFTLPVQVTLGGDMASGRENRPIEVIGFHPPVPVFRSSLVERSQALENVKNYLQSPANHGQRPVIVAGDFNLTPWSPHYRRWIQQLGLRHAGLGQGIPLSWPMPSNVRSRRPGWLLPLVRIPIDHCLVSRDFGVKRFQVLPNGNSDHAMAIADLVLP